MITANSPNNHLFLITQSSPACDDGECLYPIVRGAVDKSSRHSML